MHLKEVKLTAQRFSERGNRSERERVRTPELKCNADGQSEKVGDVDGEEGGGEERGGENVRSVRSCTDFN